MIKDFFRGGGGFPTKTELEALKMSLCKNIKAIYKEHYKSRKELCQDSGSESWVIDDILALRYGTFSSDFLISFLQTLVDKNSDIKDSVTEFELVSNPDELLISYKRNTAKKILKLIADLDHKNSDKIKKECDFEAIEAIATLKGNIITLDSLILTLLKISTLNDQIKNPVKISMSQKIKNDVMDKISSFVYVHNISNSEIVSKTGYNKSLVSRVISKKIENVSIEKLCEFFEKISNRKDSDQIEY